MELFLNIVFLILGMVFLIKGADVFVSGASTIAKLLKVPAMIIGLTIVALGTSLPELAVSTVAAINAPVVEDSVDLCVSNVVGSNIFNILMVLGLTSILVPIAIDKNSLTFEFPFMLGVTVLLFIAAITGNHTVSWVYGLIFMVLLVFYIAFLILRTKKQGTVVQEEEVKKDKKTIILSIVYLILGAGAIIFGGECVNETAVYIADRAGMQEKLIGLTIVAVGTSLPELVTSLVAAKKGEKDIALGNVIGSNTLNILFILGISSLITPLPIARSLNFDLIFLIFISVLLIAMSIIFFKKKGLYRLTGCIFVGLYVLYTAYIICRNYEVLPSWLLFGF